MLQPKTAAGRNKDSAVFGATLNSPKLQQPAEQPRRHNAGQMAPALCPIETGPGMPLKPRPKGGRRHPQLLQTMAPRFREHIAFGA